MPVGVTTALGRCGISTALPDAKILEDGLHIPMRNVSKADKKVADWIMGLKVLQ